MAMHTRDFLLAVKLCAVSCTSDLDLLALRSCKKRKINRTIITSKLLCSSFFFFYIVHRYFKNYNYIELLYLYLCWTFKKQAFVHGIQRFKTSFHNTRYAFNRNLSHSIFKTRQTRVHFLELFPLHFNQSFDYFFLFTYDLQRLSK